MSTAIRPPTLRWHIIRGVVGEYQVHSYRSEAACLRGAKKWANTDGEHVLVEHWSREHPQDELNQGWALVNTVAPDGPVVDLDIDIENRYADGTMVPTQRRSIVVVAPPPESDAQAYEDWAEKYIYPHTGTGRTEGDAWYDVTITRCSDPDLVGRTFAWGY